MTLFFFPVYSQILEILSLKFSFVITLMKRTHCVKEREREREREREGEREGGR